MILYDPKSGLESLGSSRKIFTSVTVQLYSLKVTVTGALVKFAAAVDRLTW